MIFFLLSVINSLSPGTDQGDFMEKSLYIGVVDNSESELSKGLIDYLKEKNTLTEMEDNIEYIKDQIFLQSVHAVIVIPKDFESKVRNKKEAIEIFRDDRRIESIQVENEINKYLVFSNAALKNGNLNLELVNSSLDEEIEVKMVDSKNSAKTNGANSWYKYYFNFISYIIIALYVAVIGLTMTEFNHKKIRDRVQASSKKFMSFNIEIYLGQVSIGIFITSIFILGALLLKGKYLGQVNFLKYLVNTFVFSFAILCFTFLINNITRSRFAINGISTVVSLGTSFISGVFLEQEFLSEGVLNIAKFFPTYYYVRINETQINSFIDVRYELFMQALFGISFLLLGLYFSKIKQKN